MCVRLFFLLMIANQLLAQSFELIPLDQPWRYNQSGDDLGKDWSAPGYEDSAWPVGRGVLGNEDGNSTVQQLTNTVLSLTKPDDPFIHIITYYFRTHFTVSQPVAGFSITSSNLIDDGAVVYLNGAEIYRINMPAGPIDWQTRAASFIASSNEGRFINMTFPGSYLQPGDNVMAVEVHQSDASSSDVVFGLSLDYSNIIIDRATPRILSAEMGTSLTNLTVSFEGPVDPFSATNPANYSVRSEKGEGLPVLAATLLLSNQVGLITAARADGPRYILIAKYVQAEGGSFLLFERARSIGYRIPWDTLTTPGPYLVWKYDQSGREPPSAWRGLNFDDRAWPAGLGALGFEDNPAVKPYLRTILDLFVAPCCSTQVLAYYFRTILTNASAVRSLQLRAVIDDGAVLYWNGAEILRLRMPEGPVGYTTPATQSVEAQFDGPFNISLTNILSGRNVLAAEVHQPVGFSGDVMFGLEATGIVPSEPAPLLRINRTGSQIGLSWDEPEFKLDSSDSLDGFWSQVASNGFYSTNPTGGSKFYRLRK